MIRVPQILFWFGMTLAASLLLYHTSDRVRVLDQQLHDLNTQIENEQRSLHVLKAEWVYLANPARLEASAHKFLSLRPTLPHQVVKLDELSEVLSAHDGSLATITTMPTKLLTHTASVTLSDGVVASAEDGVGASPIASLKKLAMLPPSPTVAHFRPKPLGVPTSTPTGHINDRMIMLTASATPTSGDTIGALLTNLGSHP